MLAGKPGKTVNATTGNSLKLASTALLKLLTTMNGPLEDGYESEVVREGRQCWLGSRRISSRILDEAIICSAVDDISDSKTVKRYVLSEIGRAVLRRPELAEEVTAAILSRQQFTVHDDRIVGIEEGILDLRTR